MKTTFYTFGHRYKMAFLSDLHNGEIDDILISLEQNKPDFIVFSGDLVNGNLPKTENKILESTNSYACMKKCVQIAPTYLSLGNHEYMLDELDFNVLKELGVIILDNEYVSFKDIYIGGLTSFKVLDFRKTNTIISTSRLQRVLSKKKKHFIHTDWISDFEKEKGTKILLSHHPEDIKVLKDYKIDYILSGHAHGGQWQYYNLFQRKWKGVFAPDQGFFPKYTQGIHPTKYGKMIISRGLSNTVKPIPRLLNPIEIIYINI